jgi:DNA primase
MERHLEVVYYSAEECMCTCPFCGGKSSLGFNDVKGLWICFKCGEKGTAKTLVQKLNGKYTEPEADLERLSSELRSLEVVAQQTQTFLPESYLRRFHQKGRVHKLWRDRGFDADVVDRWELGYDFLTGRLSIPFRDPFTRRLAGVIFRATDGSVPRYQYPKGFARSRSLYGSWFVAGSSDKSVILGEGPTDAINSSRTGANAVSAYGSSLSPGQVRLLHRLGVETVIHFQDYDAAGIQATKKAIEVLGGDFQQEKVVWDREKYCWKSKEVCRCSRIHQPDPGGLKVKEIDEMLGRTVKA